MDCKQVENQREFVQQVGDRGPGKPAGSLREAQRVEREAGWDSRLDSSPSKGR